MTEKYIFEEIEEQSKEIIREEVNELLSDKTFILSDCDFFIKRLTDSIGNRLKENKNPHSARVGILGLFDEVDGALEEAVEGLAL